MKDKCNRISAVIFILILLIVMLTTVFSKKITFSEVENRNLTVAQKFTASNVKNKSYMRGTEDYIADHFMKRTEWIKMKTALEVSIGKKEINDVYIVNNMMIEKSKIPVYDEVDKSISAINNLAEKVTPNVYVLIAPTASGIYMHDIPYQEPERDQRNFIDYMYENLNDKVTTIDVYNTMSAVKDEYIYYRNDHHWTSYGAYSAYKTAIQKLGFSPVTYDKFDIEHSSNEFKGTLYSKTLYDKIKSDSIDIYTYTEGAKVTKMTVNDGLKKKEYDSLYMRDYLNHKDKYCVYTGPNVPEITINTDVKNDKKILIFKDSYANCFVPFLTQHYSEIKMLDLRYINASYLKQFKFDDYSQILFLYNASTMTDDENIKKLSYI